MASSPLLRVSEVARVMRVTPGRVRQFIQTGRLPAEVARWRTLSDGRLVPHEYRVVESDVRAFAIAERHPGGPRPSLPPFDLFVPWLTLTLRSDPTISVRALHDACREGIPIRRGNRTETIRYEGAYSWFREEVTRRNLRPAGYEWHGGWKVAHPAPRPRRPFHPRQIPSTTTPPLEPSSAA